MLLHFHKHPTADTQILNVQQVPSQTNTILKCLCPAFLDMQGQQTHVLMILSFLLFIYITPGPEWDLCLTCVPCPMTPTADPVQAIGSHTTQLAIRDVNRSSEISQRIVLHPKQSDLQASSSFGRKALKCGPRDVACLLGWRRRYLGNRKHGKAEGQLFFFLQDSEGTSDSNGRLSLHFTPIWIISLVKPKTDEINYFEPRKAK